MSLIQWQCTPALSPRERGTVWRFGLCRVKALAIGALVSWLVFDRLWRFTTQDMAVWCSLSLCERVGVRGERELFVACLLLVRKHVD